MHEYDDLERAVTCRDHNGDFNSIRVDFKRKNHLCFVLSRSRNVITTNELSISKWTCFRGDGKRQWCLKMRPVRGASGCCVVTGLLVAGARDGAGRAFVAAYGLHR